jgi:hypothetical protein
MLEIRCTTIIIARTAQIRILIADLCSHLVFHVQAGLPKVRRDAEQRVIGLWVSFTRSVHLKKETKHEWRMIIFSQKGTYKVFEH